MLSIQGGGIFIDGSADLTDCNIHDNVAGDEVSPSAQIEPIACELPQDLLSSAPMERCAHAWQGGGIWVDSGGEATMIDSNVYQNQAIYVRLLSKPSRTFLPSPR